MESLRISGLISGMDTDAIVEAYMESAQAPIVTLNKQIAELTYEKTVYSSFITMIDDLNDALLNLKLESTFKSKTVSSTVESVASATASVSANTGTYTLNVSQLAEPAYASSTYISKVLSKSGAGVTGYTAGTNSAYDQLEGTHTVEVYTTDDGLWIAQDTFKGNNNDTYTVNYADTIETSDDGSTLFNSYGNSNSAISGSMQLVYTYNGETKYINFSMDYAADTSINKIASDLSELINSQLDSTFSKNGEQSVEVTVQYDEETGSFSFAFYDVDSTNTIEILGLVAADSSDTATTELIESLGLQGTYEAQSTKEITNYLVSTSSENLATKLNSAEKGGFFAPGTLTFDEETGLTEGTFQIYQDSTAVCRPATYSTFYGDTFSAIEENNPTRSEINTWLNTKIGDSDSTSYFDAGLDLSLLNGTFTVNGVEITIEDYTQYTPNELMAIVNSSGAGVTMTFDYETNSFQISSNTTGSSAITLSADTDTSSFFKVFKLTENNGATYVAGQDSGSLDTTTVISSLSPSTTTTITTGMFTINGVSIYVDTSTDTIDDVINKVNNSGAGVTMTYDSTSDKFSLTSTNGGVITVGSENDTSSFLVAVGLTYDQNVEQQIGTEGQNAVFTVNGITYTRTSNEIDDVIAGVSFTINTTGSTVLNVQIDTDKAVEALAEFVVAYNTLVNALNPTEIAYNDDLRDDYSEPLTDDDKAEMTDEEIETYQENYEKIAYYDLVTRSSELKTLKSNIRSYLSQIISSENSQFTMLTQLGIFVAGSDTQDITVTKYGFLFDSSTDVDELKAYILENSDFVDILTEYPDDVYYFFADSTTVTTTDDDGTTSSSIVSTGWARVFSDFLTSSTNSTSSLYKKTSTSGTIETQISSLKSQIESQTARVELYLERLYTKFANMETKLSELQQMSSYITNLSTS